MQLTLSTAVVALAALVGAVVGQETHTLRFMNLCGFGTPTFIDNGTIFFTGTVYTANESIHGLAFLQNEGHCGLEGENCTAIKTSLADYPGSSTRITLSAPYAYSVPVAFSYFFGEGHDSFGSFCGDPPHCQNTGITVDQSAFNANLLITFCPGPST